MIKKMFDFTNSELWSKIIYLGCYTGLIGVMIFISIKIISCEEDEKTCLYAFKKYKHFIFMFSIPVKKWLIVFTFTCWTHNSIFYEV